jgi:hypothetical protein
LSGSPSQSAKPLSHSGAHEPSEHTAMPWLLMHDWLQLPQLATPSDVLASQPLLASPSQSS